MLTDNVIIKLSFSQSRFLASRVTYNEWELGQFKNLSLRLYEVLRGQQDRSVPWDYSIVRTFSFQNISSTYNYKDTLFCSEQYFYSLIFTIGMPTAGSGRISFVSQQGYKGIREARVLNSNLHLCSHTNTKLIWLIILTYNTYNRKNICCFFFLRVR